VGGRMRANIKRWARCSVPAEKMECLLLEMALLLAAFWEDRTVPQAWSVPHATPGSCWAVLLRSHSTPLALQYS